MIIKPSGKLGKNLIRLIRVHKYGTLFGFTEATGFSWSTAYELVTGHTKSPKLNTLRQLANLFKMDVGKLLYKLTR